MRRYTTREVLAFLTHEGSVPLEHCFLAGDWPCIWAPERADLLLFQIFDGDADLHEAGWEYLRKIGAAFDST